MGKRGPAPAPTALKLVKGERKDRINHREPKPRGGMPTPPADLSEAVRAVWDYTVAEIEIMRTATPADRDLLRAYCEIVVAHQRAAKLLEQSDLLVADNRGTVRTNPAWRALRDSALAMKTLGAEFGLSPRSRSEFEAPEERIQHGASDPARLLSG